MLDKRTIGFADVAGNRQCITLGNLSENPGGPAAADRLRAMGSREDLGTARVVDDDPGLLARLMPAGFRARPEQAILFTVSAWSRNCPQHIPQRFDAADLSAALNARVDRIAALEQEVAHLGGAV